jgi:hypothetical protein
MVQGIKHWDEYTPDYDGDDHLSVTNRESECLKIGVEEATCSVRQFCIKKFVRLLSCISRVD